MSYLEQPAAPALRRWVECVWSIETDEAVPAHPVRPDGCIDILYSPAGLHVVGAMTVERRFPVAARSRTVGLRFRPGMAAALLRVPAAELTDRIAPLEAFWNRAARELAERLGESASVEACRNLLGTALSPPDGPPNGVQRAIEAVTASKGDTDLEHIARQAGMSERQFRRRCQHESGLAPKQLCRVLRFRHAFALGSRGLPWGLIAAEAGYFDQAHLIRDFREFTGATPMSVFSNTNDARLG